MFLGVDIGGTKTETLLADRNGRVIFHGLFEGASFESLGVEEARRRIEKAVRETVNGNAVDFAFFGVAGFDHEEDVEIIESMLSSFDFPYSFDNDGRIALRSGTLDDIGIMVSCGTGSVSYASDGKSLKRIGGYSFPFGERLGAFYLASLVTSAVVRAKDGRGKWTSLVDGVEKRLGTDITSFRRLTRNGFDTYREYVPGIIEAFFEAFEENDPVAMEIALSLVEEIVSIVRAHEMVLEFESPVKVVLEGTCFKKSPKSFKRTVEVALGRDHILVVPEHPPVVGAVLMAMEGAGIEVSEGLARKIVSYFE